MYRRFIPSVLMLTAGAVTCLITMMRQYPLLRQMQVLLLVLVLFYLLGSVIQWTLDYFDRQNSRAANERETVIEKESDNQDKNE